MPLSPFDFLRRCRRLRFLSPLCLIFIFATPADERVCFTTKARYAMLLPFMMFSDMLCHAFTR